MFTCNLNKLQDTQLNNDVKLMTKYISMCYDYLYTVKIHY